MRTDIEKQIAKRSFQNELKNVPPTNMFGEDVHTKIKLCIELINGNTTMDDVYDVYEDDFDLIMHVEEVENWLNGEDIPFEDLLIDERSLVTEKDVNTKQSIVVCSKMCNECPFSKTSLAGFLADYSIQDFQDFMRIEASFPCHKTMKGDTNTDETTKMIEDGSSYFCRGYVESIIKSAKSPYKNKLLVQAIEKVKSEGLSDNSMSIFEFIKFHNHEKN